MCMPKCSLLVLIGGLTLLLLAACGDEDGEAEFPDPGLYSSSISGTMEIEFVEARVSAAPFAQDSEFAPVEGDIKIEFKPDGSFTISGPNDLRIDTEIKGDTVTFTQNEEEPSEGQTTPEGSTLDLNLEAELASGETAQNEDPIHLQSDDFLFIDGGLTFMTPPDFQGEFYVTSDGRAIFLVITIELNLDGLLKLDEVPEVTATAEPEATATTAAAPKATETPLPTTSGDPKVDAALGLLGVPPDSYGQVFFDTDPANDHIFGDPNQTPGFTPPHTDLTGFFAARLSVSPETASAYDERFPCNSSFGDNQVICPDGAGPFSTGDVFLVGGVFNGAVPVDPDRSCTYATVLDAGTSWVPQGPFAFDFYQSAGRWYQASGHPGAPWTVSVLEVDAQQQPQFTPSDMRVFFLRDVDVVAFALPGTEISGAMGWRVTADCNLNFDPPQSGGDVPGPDPTHGLIPLPEPLLQPGEPICDGAFTTCP